MIESPRRATFEDAMKLTSEMTDEEILTAAARRLPRSRLVYGEDGGEAGVVYFAYETRRWYAVDVDACRALLEMPLTEGDFGGDFGDVGRFRRDGDAYSRWCADPQHRPCGEGATEAEARRAAGWYEANEHPMSGVTPQC
jgi:hypothetical protein